jgi:hypothetical protein
MHAMAMDGWFGVIGVIGSSSVADAEDCADGHAVGAPTGMC